MAERPSQPLFAPSPQPRHAPLAPSPQPRHARRADCVRSTVLITSVLLILVSAMLSFIAGEMSYSEFSDDSRKWENTFPVSTLLVACSSAATFLLSTIIDQIYICRMPGIVVFSTEHDLATPGLRRWFRIVSSCYWIFFVGGETCLIVAIKGLYDRESLWPLFGVAVFLDIFAACFMVGLDSIAGDIHQHILLLDPMTARINALPEFVAESAAYDNCVICIEPPTVGDRVRELSCRHKFHKACIDRWLLRTPLCPLCKREV